MPDNDDRLNRMEGNIERAWSAIEVLADKQAKLDDVMATLADSHIKLVARIDDVARLDAERGRRLDERIDNLARLDAERGRKLDERIDKLVSAIGELVRGRNGGKG